MRPPPPHGAQSAPWGPRRNGATSAERSPHRASCARWGAIPGVFERGATQPAGCSAGRMQLEFHHGLLKGVAVLIVDDDAETRELLQVIVGNACAEAVVAASAREAVDVFDRRRRDLLVSDIGMPGEDGYSLIRRIRSRRA